MTKFRCPGQDTRFWRARDFAEVDCAACGHAVELWPDDLLRKCPGCGQGVSNPNFSMKCLEWCRFAPKCMEHMRSAREEASGPLKEELTRRILKVFGDDACRIDHAVSVLRIAERIGRLEGADPLVIVPAALLHDIGLAGTGPDSDSPAVRRHGQQGAENALELLSELGFPNSVARAVTDIIAHHHERGAMEDANGRVLWDADLIVNLGKLPRGEALDRLRREALTDAGLHLGPTYLGT